MDGRRVGLAAGVKAGSEVGLDVGRREGRTVAAWIPPWLAHMKMATMRIARLLATALLIRHRREPMIRKWN
jgi:hypothetical protein